MFSLLARKMIRRAVWFLVGLLLGGWLALSPVLAQAETIAASSVTSPNVVGMWWSVTTTAIHNNVSADAACKQANAGWYATKAASGYNWWDCHRSDGSLPGYQSGAWCDANLQNVGGEPSCGPGVVTYSCPVGQNWTLSGSSCSRPDCVAPDVRNVATGLCEAPPCTSKAPIGGGATYFDYGTSAAGAFPSIVCSGGCLAVFSGTSPAGSAVVDGVKHYFAFGAYTYAGGGSVDACTAGAGTPAPGAGSEALPVSHCAPNQIEGLINGKLQCYNVPGSGVPPVAAPTSAPETSTAGTSTTNVSTVGDTTTTTNTTYNSATNSTVVVTTACTGGNCSSTTTETKTPVDPTESDEVEGVPVVGTLPATGELVTEDSRTLQTVWNTRKAELFASPLIGLASSLTSFPGSTGACPSWSVEGSIFGQSQGGTISPPCWIWAVLRAFLMLTALFVARRLIFGG